MISEVMTGLSPAMSHLTLWPTIGLLAAAGTVGLTHLIDVMSRWRLTEGGSQTWAGRR